VIVGQNTTGAVGKRRAEGSVIEGGFQGQAALPSREPATFLSHIPNKSVPAFANWNWVLKRLTEAP